MKILLIEALSIAGISSTITHSVGVELDYPNMKFIGDIPIKDLVSYADNEKLLRAIIENDPSILTDFLKEKNISIEA